jgi:hypothetical protein
MTLWSQEPNFDEVRITFARLGIVKARIKQLRGEVELSTLEIKKNNPRKPYLIIEATQGKQQEINELEQEQMTLEAKIDFLMYWKEIYKTQGFINR